MYSSKILYGLNGWEVMVRGRWMVGMVGQRKAGSGGGVGRVGKR